MLRYNEKPISDEQYASRAEISFVGYTGCDNYATLCMGDLQLDINGKRYLFKKEIN